MGEAVSQMRVVVTATDDEAALRFYRDELGLPELGAFTSIGGRVSLLDAGRATLEIADPPRAAYVDEVEVGRRVAGHIRIAFQVADARRTSQRLTGAGATLLAAPVEQLTLFEELPRGPEPPAGSVNAARSRSSIRPGPSTLAHPPDVTEVRHGHARIPSI